MSIKKYFEYNLILTSIIYIVFYIIFSFISWDLYNPFEWIIKIGTYEEFTRMSILLCYCCYNAILYFIIKSIDSDDKELKKTRKEE